MRAAGYIVAYAALATLSAECGPPALVAWAPRGPSFD